MSVIGSVLMVAILFCAGIGPSLIPEQHAMAQTPAIYTQMDATVAGTGMSLYSGRPVHAEYVDSGSVLIGKMVDSIMLKLRKVGSPTGIATVGIMYENTTMKKVFGTLDVSTLTGTYTDKIFNLTADQSAYKIVSGDYIGIKYLNGSDTNQASVMRNSTGGFDGSYTYHKYYTTTWTSQTTKDLYMKLTYTPPKYVMIHFDDGFRSQYTNATSILDEYDIKATFFIVCKYANFTNSPGYMTWSHINSTRDLGHNIQNHGAVHDDYQEMSTSEIQSYPAQCKQQLNSKGYTSEAFALPFNSGDDNSTVITNIAAGLPSTSFGKGDNDDQYAPAYNCNDPDDMNKVTCDITDGGSYNQDNRFTMPQWSYDGFRWDGTSYPCTENNSAAVTQGAFEDYVNLTQVDASGKLINVPIVTYHRVDEAGKCGISMTELENHMAYLSNNHFWPIVMSDIQYNTTAKTLELKVPG
jgi:peptidoglycan/xylan/chitin deacetylase (PgdA/CDA1 family)